MAGWRAGPERRKGRNLQEEPRQAENQEAERHQLQTEEVDCSTQKLLVTLRLGFYVLFK